LICWHKFIKILLSTYAEDRGFCPWMNAQKVDKSFMCSKLDASVDFATGG